MEIKKRSIRRHHYDRMKRRGKRQWVVYWNNEEDPLGIYGWTSERRYGFYANTRCPCSSACCGNPRHHQFFKRKDRLTKQELISEQIFKEQLLEI